MKLVYADYNVNTRESKVRIYSKYGISEGTAKVSPEDSEYASRYVGCEIAELRAIQNLYKKRIKILNIEINTLLQLKSIFKKEENKDLFILEKEIEKREKIKKDFSTKSSQIHIAIKQLVEKHIQTKKKLIEKYEKKQD